MAYAPTTRNSTSSADNADNMSLKSGFRNRFSLESPGIERELPHHPDPFLGSRSLEVRLGPLLAQLSDAHLAVRLGHARHDNRRL